MIAIAASIFTLFAAGTSALALPQGECADVMEYKDLVQSEPFSEGSKMATSFTCTSGPDTNCEISKGVAHTVGVEWSISGGISAGLDLGKIFSLGVEAGFSYAWSTSDETSQGVTLICPEGGIECGGMVTAKLVKITGKTRVPPGGLGCPGDNEWHDFEVTAPQKETDAGDAVMNFEACLMSCGSAQYPDSCDVAYANGPSAIPICPSKTTAPCQGAVGGTCGTVPAMS